MAADPDLFFDEERTREALAVCSDCPSRMACLDYALGNEEFGVWGGTTPAARRDLRGGWLNATPEDRRVVWELRERLQSTEIIANIASGFGVTERTLYRWMAEARDLGVGERAA